MSKKMATILAIAVLLVGSVILVVILALQPPASFRRAISATDRIEIVGPEIIKSDEHQSKIGYQSRKIVVAGKEARGAARSLRFGFWVGYPWCLSEARVRFYQGTNLLTEAGMCVESLEVNGKWYNPRRSGKRLIRSWSERLRQTGRLETSPTSSTPQ
jgi:hypothetical protein